MCKKSEQIESLFPKINEGDGYCVTSEPDTLEKVYNCIAWAAGVTDRGRWWPSSPDINEMVQPYWPIESSDDDLNAFIDGFRSLGYEPCEDSKLEDDYEKVAIFGDRKGGILHMARQLSNGRWTSKCGPLEDIEHDLEGISGREYGQVQQCMKRKRLIESHNS